MASVQMPITIYQAMQYISNNYYLLPAFQRDFVWSPDQIERLFDSLMRDYPTSSMLFWKVKGETRTRWKFYKFINSFILKASDRAIDNELFPNPNSDFYAVLDGQQRLTAMRIGLYGKYYCHEKNRSWSFSPNAFPARSLYLNISKRGSIGDDCTYLFEFKKDCETNEETFFIDASSGDIWFKVGAIIGFHQSGDCIDDYFDTIELTRNQRRIINILHNTIFQKQAITYFEEDDQNPDKAVQIFTRINSGGTALSFANIVFSLMVANWTRKNARNEIKQLKETVANKSFDIDEEYIIKAFLYLYHKNVKTEINSFDSEFCAKIEDNWEAIRDAILSLFDLLRCFGLNSSSLTSNNATLPILYYIYHKNIYDNFANRIQYVGEREQMKNWLYSAILRKQFSHSTDAILQKSRRAYTDDIKACYLREGVVFDGRVINSNIRGEYAELTEETLNDLLSTQKDDRYAFVILSLLYPHLDYKNNNFHKDHLFAVRLYADLPEATREAIPFKVYNSIVNLQMLDSNENESKGEKLLSDWIEQSCSSEDMLERFLAAHLIPNVDLSISNIQYFFTSRQELLKQKLRAMLI